MAREKLAVSYVIKEIELVMGNFGETKSTNMSDLCGTVEVDGATRNHYYKIKARIDSDEKKGVSLTIAPNAFVRNVEGDDLSLDKWRGDISRFEAFGEGAGGDPEFSAEDASALERLSRAYDLMVGAETLFGACPEWGDKHRRGRRSSKTIKCDTLSALSSAKAEIVNAVTMTRMALDRIEKAEDAKKATRMALLAAAGMEPSAECDGTFRFVLRKREDDSERDTSLRVDVDCEGYFGGLVELRGLKSNDLILLLVRSMMNAYKADEAAAGSSGK